MRGLYLYPAVFITTILIDFVWLGLISKNFYAKELGTLMKSPPNLYSALGVYLVLSLGLVFFITNNQLATSYTSYALLGALFGLIVYTVYDLTNYAVISGYTLKLVVVDIIWGTVLGGTLGLITKFFYNI